MRDNLEKLKVALLGMKNNLRNLLIGGLIMGVLMIFVVRGSAMESNAIMALLLYYGAVIGVSIFFGLRHKKTLAPEASFNSIEAFAYSLVMLVIGFTTSAILGGMMITGYLRLQIYSMYPGVSGMVGLRNDNSNHLFAILIISIFSIVICGLISAYFTRKKSEGTAV